ncbi:MAG: hypothetical protein IKP28_00530 [Clostridia bacterium]|nr:hypothetical protein [Clostridia bacterium]
MREKKSLKIFGLEYDRSDIKTVVLMALVIIIGILSMVLIPRNEAMPLRANMESGALTTVRYYYDDMDNSIQRVTYDPETKVMYLIVNGSLITPLYNTDGSLKLYDGE